MTPAYNTTSGSVMSPSVNATSSGVAPDAPDDVVSAVARRLMAKHHADGDEPDSSEFDRVRKARDAMLEDSQ